MAAMDKEAILSKLQELSIDHINHVHAAPVMTAEAQAADLGDMEGAVTKNLFLKDKRGHLYIITTLADTNVDLKTLSARLGVGKGGIRLAPDELVREVLHVPQGSVTPLAVAQPTATNVVLLLDTKLRQQRRIFVHPLDNTVSTSLSPAGLEAFLQSLGREAVYVDLETEVVVDKDNPPDLKPHAEKFAAIAAAPADSTTAVAPAAKAAPATAAAKQQTGKKAAKGATAATAVPAATAPRADVQAVTEVLVAKALAVLGGSAALDDDVVRRLKADLEAELGALRNAAYASGFSAARGGIAQLISREFA